MKKLQRKLALLWVFSSAVSVSFGYYCGSRDSLPSIHLFPIAIEVQAIPCDTDLDCYEKNGCGGYADPCSEEPEIYTGVEEISA